MYRIETRVQAYLPVRPARRAVDFEAKPKELTGRSRSVSKDFTEQMKLIHKHTITHIY